VISTLQIINFQTHAKLRVDFGRGITTIVGPSDAGKSAVLRALRWVCTSEPSGDAFVRHGSKGASVRLLVDGHEIIRRRSPGGGVNEYVLDGVVLKAIGRDVPEPIARILNLGPVCWQRQHDAPFWFSETQGEVSRQLNAIVNLGVIDGVMARVGAEQRRARAAVDAARVACMRADADVAAHEWVGGCEELFERLDALYKDAEALALEVSGFKDAVRAATDAKAAAACIEARSNAMADVADAAGMAFEKRKAANGLAVALQHARDGAEAIKTPPPGVDTLERAYRAANAAAVARNGMQAAVTAAKIAWEGVCGTEKARNRAEMELPKACPACGRSL